MFFMLKQSGNDHFNSSYNHKYDNLNKKLFIFSYLDHIAFNNIQILKYLHIFCKNLNNLGFLLNRNS